MTASQLSFLFCQAAGFVSPNRGVNDPELVPYICLFFRGGASGGGGGGVRGRGYVPRPHMSNGGCNHKHLVEHGSQPGPVRQC